MVVIIVALIVMRPEILDRQDAEADGARTGNAQLLEATHPRTQVLPRRGGPTVGSAQKLHPGLSRGMYWETELSLHDHSSYGN